MWRVLHINCNQENACRKKICEMRVAPFQLPEEKRGNGAGGEKLCKNVATLCTQV